MEPPRPLRAESASVIERARVRTKDDEEPRSSSVEKKLAERLEEKARALETQKRFSVKTDAAAPVPVTAVVEEPPRPVKRPSSATVSARASVDDEGARASSIERKLADRIEEKARALDLKRTSGGGGSCLECRFLCALVTSSDCCRGTGGNVAARDGAAQVAEAPLEQCANVTASGPDVCDIVAEISQ